MKTGCPGNLIEFDGKKRTLSEWARHLGISRSCLQNRLYTYGWTIKETFTTPVDTTKRHKQL